jgi:acetate kinase
MSDVILVFNAGSSSLKFEVFGVDGGRPSSIVSGKIEELTTAAVFDAEDAAGRRIGEHRWSADAPPGHDGAIAFLGRWLAEQAPGTTLRAVGHRVVHGGTKYHAPVRVDAGVLADLDQLVPLAPLHQPHNLSGIRAVAAQRPQLPQVACFDTAFHTTQDELAQMFALPHRFAEAGVRRYGFHGLSYEYIASVLPSIDARAAAGRTVVAHLGNGASLCAMAGGRSGVLIYLMDEHGMDARAIERLLYKESGLLGVSGRSSDMRELLAADDDRCRLAVDLFCYRAAREIGSLAAALGGLDALVVTAGIGEHAAPVRERIARRCAWLGVEIDEAANAAGGPLVTTAGSRVAAWVVPTDEEGMIARHTLALLNGR